MSSRERLSAAMSPASMLIAILALVVAAAGVGYAAGTIGTNDIKNNAVTSKKVKNGTLKNGDMVKENKFTYVGRAGGVRFSNGGQGDCVWQSGDELNDGFPGVGYRKDRFGTVHLVGVAQSSNGSAGDESCDSAEPEDAIAFRLPSAMRPAKTHIAAMPNDSTLVVVGATGLTVESTTLPSGAVFVSGDRPVVYLDGVSFQPAGSKLVSSGSAEKMGPEGRRLLHDLLDRR